MSPRKILLLNPPAPHHSLRDYYCPGLAKSDYYYHPVDLLYLSGRLAPRYEVRVLDAPPRRLTREDALAAVTSFEPDVVLSLVSMPTFAADDLFLRSIRQALPATRIIATGDVYREYREGMFERQPYLDACLVDFSTDDILRYLEGPLGAPVNNIIYRDGGALVAGPEIHHKGVYSVPPPLWSEFPSELYSIPLIRTSPFATVLSDFGCIYQCAFCPLSTINYKLRPVEEVLSEIKDVWARGYREVHFRDQTFGCELARTLELCSGLRRDVPGLTWSCFSRVDVLDEKRLKAMAESGCHTVIFGIEFADESLQVSMKKNIKDSQIRSAVGLCRRHGIRVAGTFIIGLPDQGREELLRTGDLAVSLGLDFASFNIAMPRMATRWRNELIASGKVDPLDWNADTGKGTTAWKHPKLSREEVFALSRLLEKRFYLRGSYILKMLAGLRTWAELRMFVKSGLGVMFKQTS